MDNGNVIECRLTTWTFGERHQTRRLSICPFSEHHSTHSIMLPPRAPFLTSQKGYNLYMTTLRPPAYIVWSTDQIDLSDPFQHRWYIQQVLTHGRAEDIRALKLDEIAAALDDIVLPDDVRSLWQRFLETRRAEG